MRRRDLEETMRHLRDELTHVARVAALGDLSVAITRKLTQPLTAISRAIVEAHVPADLQPEHAGAKPRRGRTLDVPKTRRGDGAAPFSSRVETLSSRGRWLALPR